MARRRAKVASLKQIPDRAMMSVLRAGPAFVLHHKQCDAVRFDMDCDCVVLWVRCSNEAGEWARA